MSLGDLLNFDYGMNEWGAPLWAGGFDGDLVIPDLDMGGVDVPLTLGMLDTGGVMDPTFQGALDGGAPSPDTLAQIQAAGSQNNADAIARMQAAVAAGGAPNPQDLRVMYSNFGIPFSRADLGGGLPGSSRGLMDMLRGSGVSGSGGGGGNVGITMPRIDAPAAGEVPAMAVPGVPQTPAPAPFSPVQFDTRPPADDGDMRGLRRLLAGRR